MRHGLMAAALTTALVVQATQSQAQLFEVVGEEAAAPKGGEEKAAPPPAEAKLNETAPPYKKKREAGRYGPPAEKKQDTSKGAAAVAPETSVRIKERKPVNVYGEIYLGQGTATIAGGRADSLNIKATAVNFIVGGTFDLAKVWALGLAVPFSWADMDPVRAEEVGSRWALGAPQIIAQYNGLKVGKRITLPIQFSIG